MDRRMMLLALINREKPIPLWDTPTIELNDSIVSTPIVEGVTKYKVYDNSVYIGYIDSSNTWHADSE